MKSAFSLRAASGWKYSMNKVLLWGDKRVILADKVQLWGNGFAVL